MSMRGPSWWGVGIAIVVWGHSLSTFAASEAPPVEDVREELERVKQRLDSLEERERSVNVGAEDAKGHRLHPIHSLGEAKISGGVTMIGQGVSSDQLIDPVTGPGDKAEATLSLDLFLEHQISQDGRVLVHLDVQQGAGLTNIPVFAAPNGNTTGPNNDVESFLSDQVHLDQAYYEHTWMDERIGLTIGQYDPTAYFDTNAFANNERFQFMANLFGNNSALEFGGTGNFYGFGGVLRVKPVDWLDLMVGAMEGDGDFVEAFSRPWTIAEADIYTDWAGRKGTYRVYVWQNRSHFNLLPGGQDVANQGIGLSMDQQLSDHLGVWARYGTQKGAVAAFDRSMSGGLHISGGFFGRPHDAIGVGYGLTMISGDYRAAQAAAALPEFDRNEGYFETYYRLVLSGDGETQGFAVSPDIQYITHAGGNSALEPITVYGMRVQAFF